MSTLLSQLAVETLRNDASSAHNLSQLSVEVIRGSTFEIQSHQLSVEVIRGSTFEIQLYQLAIEVLRPNVGTSTTSEYRTQVSACP